VPIGWNQDDFDVLEDGVIVGRIFFLAAVGPEGRPWMWASGHDGDIRRAGTAQRARPPSRHSPRRQPNASAVNGTNAALIRFLLIQVE
jgi:hypothetical protein